MSYEVFTKTVSSQFQEVLNLLRNNFLSHEPCAAAVNLCPLGYRIPAWENLIKGILVKGISFLAVKDETVVGVVVCDIKKDKEEAQAWVGKEEIFPQTLLELRQFFHDLSTNYGTYDVHSMVGAAAVLFYSH